MSATARPPQGAHTPQRLAKLRQAIYAILGDSLLFSQAEQLQLSLTVHECQDAAELRHELARLQHETDRRLRVLRQQELAAEGAPALADEASLAAAFAQAVRYPALDHVARPLRQAYGGAWSDYRRVNIIGEVWSMVLGHLHRSETPRFVLN